MAATMTDEHRRQLQRPEPVVQLLTLQETADELGVSLSTVKRLIRARRLAATHIGGLTRVRWDVLQRFIDSTTGT
jgi:excisionase family DNA binding protein